MRDMVSPPHTIFFIAALSFMSGIIFASLGLSLWLALLFLPIFFGIMAAAGIYAELAIMSAILVIVGSSYYFWDDARYKTDIEHVPAYIRTRGTIIDDPRQEFQAQSFTLKTNLGKLSIQTEPFPLFAYGDEIFVEGSIKKPDENLRGRVLQKDHRVGSMHHPHITKNAEHKGDIILASLFKTKHHIQKTFKNLLPSQESALLSGIALGANENITNGFKNKLSLAGVRHLTAINGLHMTILCSMMLTALSLLFPRRIAFAVTIIFAGLFTALVGFTVSAIRASLMVFAAGFAHEVGRPYARENGLLLAALVLAIINPKVIVFDAGFQLSFLAMLAIMYVSPALRFTLQTKKIPMMFHIILDPLLITISVQLVTAPILISQFQNFSLTACIANVLILPILPSTMALGFLIGLVSFVNTSLASIIALVTIPFLKFIIWTVNAASNMALRFNPSIGFAGIEIYYSLLLLFILWLYRYMKQYRVIA